MDIHNSEITVNIVRGSAGAVSNDNGTVTITNTTMSNNEAGFYGGAIDNNAGIFTIIDSIIEDNQARFGGAATFNSGTMDLVNTSVTGNEIVNSEGNIRINGAVNNTGILNISQNSQITNRRKNKEAVTNGKVAEIFVR